jgi:hypothetical protein
MNQISGFDPEDERSREESGVLLLRVGLALIDDARHGDGFETDEVKLAARVDEVLDELGANDSDSDETPVQVTSEGHDRVLLSVKTDEHSSDSALLRADGILLDEYTSFGFGSSAHAIDADELSPEQQEELRRARADYEARMKRREFHGAHFRRVLTAEPQSQSGVQILAVELYADGLIVHYTFDQDPESTESTESGEPFGNPRRMTQISLEDDLGTEYYESDGGEGGVQVFHGARAFTPAIPEAASLLRVSARGGTVEFTL